MTSRTTVLFGAGASKDAGLPLTNALAADLVKRANAPWAGRGRFDWLSALNFVYGSMVGYQAEDGGNPLEAVNIERLISALRLLQNSGDHEVAPFVSTWKVGALGVGTPSSSGPGGQAILDAVGNAASGRSTGSAHSVERAVADIARTATRKGNPNAFRTAEAKVLEGLSELLGDLKTVDYLTPLAEMAREQVGGLDIITLNYDLAVEQMASQTSTPIERGIPAWNPAEPLRFDQVDGRLNLIKLHGSLDWVVEGPTRAMSSPTITVATSGDTDQEDAAWSRPPRPWIVVGDREKLATDGPTLALLRAAEDALRRSTHLVVVGYSFSDAHINSLIRDWLGGRPDRTIGIVDVAWDMNRLDPFRRSLLQTYGASENRQARILPLKGSTKDRLAEALRLMPARTPDRYATVEGFERNDQVVHVSVRLHGPDLHEATINVVGTAPGSTRERGLDTFRDQEEVDSQPQSPSTCKLASFNHWERGTLVEVFTRGSVNDVRKLSVSGRRFDSWAYTELVVDIS